MTVAFDQHVNFAYSTVQAGSGVIGSTSGTTINIVNTLDLPDPAAGAYNVTVWPSGVNPTQANAEIMRVTAKSSATLTVTRAQEGTTALSVIAAGYQVALTMTSKLLTDIEAATTGGGGGGGGGGEIGYDQTTASVVVSSTTESAGTTVITCGAHTFDGAPVMVQFFCVNAIGGSAGLIVNLFEGSTQIARLLYNNSGSAGVIQCSYRFTPSAGSHTYKITAYISGSNATLTAGAGGTAGFSPMFVRFTKV